MKRMRWIWALAAAAVACSCAALKGGKPPLRVGMTPNYPPIVMLQEDGRVTGAECDFATLLARDLGRPLELVSVPWDMLLEDLAAGEIDIVMSGMTVTTARMAKAAFCDPYMNNPLIAITRRGESSRFLSAEEVMDWSGGIGVMQGTSADTFVRRKFQSGKILPVTSRDDVVFYLANQRFDLYVDDLAAAVDIVSRNESRLELVRIPLESQHLAWAVRADNAELKRQANEALARWRTDGRLDQVLDRWMPYRRLLAETAAK